MTLLLTGHIISEFRKWDIIRNIKTHSCTFLSLKHVTFFTAEIGYTDINRNLLYSYLRSTKLRSDAQLLPLADFYGIEKLSIIRHGVTLPMLGNDTKWNITWNSAKVGKSQNVITGNYRNLIINYSLSHIAINKHKYWLRLIYRYWDILPVYASTYMVRDSLTGFMTTMLSYTLKLHLYLAFLFYMLC